MIKSIPIPISIPSFLGKHSIIHSDCDFQPINKIKVMSSDKDQNTEILLEIKPQKCQGSYLKNNDSISLSEGSTYPKNYKQTLIGGNKEISDVKSKKQKKFRNVSNVSIMGLKHNIEETNKQNSDLNAKAKHMEKFVEILKKDIDKMKKTEDHTKMEQIKLQGQYLVLKSYYNTMCKQLNSIGSMFSV